MNERKRQAMDACSHKETLAHIRVLKGSNAPAAKSTGLLPAGMKQQMMSAVASVETVAHVGMVKLTGGVALYAAHIRQMDKANRPVQQRQQSRRDEFGRHV